MKISNFKPINGSTTHATVLVTAGFWFFKFEETLRVSKEAHGGNWFWFCNGEWTPQHRVEALERAYWANVNLPDEAVDRY